jgi:hypothetical protein
MPISRAQNNQPARGGSKLCPEGGQSFAQLGGQSYAQGWGQSHAQEGGQTSCPVTYLNDWANQVIKT